MRRLAKTTTNPSKWRARNLILLLLATALIVSQIAIFFRYMSHDGKTSSSLLDLSSFVVSSTKSNKMATRKVTVSRQGASIKGKLQNVTSKNFEVANFPTRVRNATSLALLQKANPEADGVFNGYPIYKQSGSSTSTSSPIHSQIHCIGETWHPPAFWKRKRDFLDVSWQHRSCKFEFFCYDVQEQEFVLYLNQKEKEETAQTFSHLDNYTSFWDVSQTYFRDMVHVMPNQKEIGRNVHIADRHYPYGVSIGSINGKWAQTGIPRLNWFPKVRYGPIPIQNYDVYTLHSSVVMIPFHSLSASNPGHLVWDDWLPLYSLLEIFGFANNNNADAKAFDPLLLRYILPPDPLTNDTRGLWAGCDWLAEKAAACQKMLHKFAPLIMRKEAAWQTTTQRDPDLVVFNEATASESNGDNNKKQLVCAKNGLAGIGQLSDHGVDKGHGWEERDYTMIYNLGRGGQFWRFRNYMMKNIGVANPEAAVPSNVPLKVYFSANSSDKAHRSMSFEVESRAVKEALESRSKKLGLPSVEVEALKFSKYTVKEQVEMASKAAVFVTTCGGGAVTATFLPRGASLVIYFPGKGGVENNKWSGKPARLDWDYFNNLGYLRVSWLPQPSKVSMEEILQSRDVLVDLILHELQVVYQERQLKSNSDN